MHHLELHPTDAALWLDTTGNLAPARLATLVASRSRNDSEKVCVYHFPKSLSNNVSFALVGGTDASLA
jgi:hypothetical protein